MTSTARFRPAVRAFVLANALAVMAWGQSAPPRIFYSDLFSGPNRGGRNNAGALDTIYSKYFEAIQGGSTVTVGGGASASCQIWTDSKITFRLGSAAAPWATLPHAVQTMSGGEIVSAMNGVSQLTDDGQGWDAALTLRTEWGTFSSSRAMAAYPGATVTVGAADALSPRGGTIHVYGNAL